MGGKSERRGHAERVLDHLSAQSTPRSAYEILESLRAEGVTASTMVYRALDKLVAAGRVHRIESLSAWMACCGRSHSETPVFEICGDCGAVAEYVDARLSRDIAALSERTGFKPDHSVIEVHGRCVACHIQAPTA